MQDRIADAIKCRTVLTITYENEARTIEPHLLGYNEDDHLTVQCWQTTGQKPGWRNFLLSEIQGLSQTSQTFSGARHGYHPQGLKWRILAQL